MEAEKSLEVADQILAIVKNGSQGLLRDFILFVRP